MKIEVAGDKVSLAIDGTYTAEELSKLVQQIGQARAQIAKDPDDPKGIRLDVCAQPRWYTEFNAFSGHHLLCLRSGLGWQGFALSPHDTATLVHFLSGQLANLLATAIAAAPDLTGDGGKDNPAIH